MVSKKTEKNTIPRSYDDKIENFEICYLEGSNPARVKIFASGAIIKNNGLVLIMKIMKSGK